MVERLLEDSGTKPWAQLYVDTLETYNDLQVNGDLSVLNDLNITGDLNVTGEIDGLLRGNVIGDVQGGDISGNFTGTIVNMQPGFNLRLSAQLLLTDVKNPIITTGLVVANGNYDVGGLIFNGLVSIPADGRYMITASVLFQWNTLAAGTRELVKLYVETNAALPVKIIGTEVNYIGNGAVGDIINMNLCGIYQLTEHLQMRLFFEVPNLVANEQIIHQGAFFSIQRLT